VIRQPKVYIRVAGFRIRFLERGFTDLIRLGEIFESILEAPQTQHCLARERVGAAFFQSTMRW